jgi:hypothetical protein
MIKIFRTLRWSSLQSILSSAEGRKRIPKYLLYAAGEIILVVIGILIALQINTNSENKKKRQLEITILQNIKEDILADRVDCEFNFTYLKTQLEQEQLLFDFLMDQEAQPPEGIVHSEVLGIDLILSVHSASFKNLQNNDVGLVSNNELYKNMTRFYDFYVVTLKKLENDHEYSNTYRLKLPFFQKHFKVVPKKSRILAGQSPADYFEQDYEWYNYEIKDLLSVKGDEGFKILLAESIGVNTVKVSFYDQLLTKSDELTKAIDSELDVLIN